MCSFCLFKLINELDVYLPTSDQCKRDVFGATSAVVWHSSLAQPRRNVPGPTLIHLSVLCEARIQKKSNKMIELQAEFDRCSISKFAQPTLRLMWIGCICRFVLNIISRKHRPPTVSGCLHSTDAGVMHSVSRRAAVDIQKLKNYLIHSQARGWGHSKNSLMNCLPSEGWGHSKNSLMNCLPSEGMR